MESTARAKLPLLAPGQTQKEAFHNEALLLLDCLIGGSLISQQATDPPATPDAAVAYDVPGGATGYWSGKDGMLAAYTEGGWRFVAPFEGLRMIERASGLEWRWTGAAWERGIVRAEELVIDGRKVVGGQGTAIAAPSGGATVDSEARNCLVAILESLRGHGLIET